LEVLEAAYGEGARVSPAELEPFLGEEGGAPPWDLTDALDKGDTALAVEVAHRLLGSGGRHPFQLLATLHRHYGAMLRLDGTGITDPAEVATLLAMSPFPARKVLDQARRLGSERVARAVSLIAGADLDLRGVLDWPDELVIEVLVARLAQLSRSRPAAAAGTTRRGR
jgi:DNA polymerase-3 subunit delta